MIPKRAHNYQCIKVSMTPSAVRKKKGLLKVSTAQAAIIATVPKGGELKIQFVKSQHKPQNKPFV